MTDDTFKLDAQVANSGGGDLEQKPETNCKICGMCCIETESHERTLFAASTILLNGPTHVSWAGGIRASKMGSLLLKLQEMWVDVKVRAGVHAGGASPREAVEATPGS